MNYEKADFWAQKAKKEGFPARSVYKLKELDEKFKLLPPATSASSAVAASSVACGSQSALFNVLDLGAAPGSWSLYLIKKLSLRLKLTACDLKELEFEKSALPKKAESSGSGSGAVEHCNGQFLAITGDFTLPEIQLKIKERAPFSLILSDAAPSTSGNRLVDTQKSLSLNEQVLNYAETMLEAGGACVFKLFQGGDVNVLFKKARGLFKKVKTFKPSACRSNSFETYLVCLEKLMPY